MNFINKNFVNEFINDKFNTNDFVVGSGYDGYNCLYWFRYTHYNDFEVYYKGIKYIVSHSDIIQILKKTNKINSIEKILRTYIDNNFNVNLTILHLIV